MPKNKKPKVGIVSLTCCEGCEFAILDLGNKFLELTKRIDLKEFHLIEELPERGKYDIVFIEGTPLLKSQFEKLKSLRRRTKILVALGTCATHGGVQKMKNYHPDIVKPKFVYNKPKYAQNYKVKPLQEVVSVDYEVLGCPIDGKDFLRIVYQLLAGRIPKNIQRPVCYECQINKYECLLQKGKPCLGPISAGGCDAVCLSGKLECYGCRGFLKEFNKKNIVKALKDKIPEKQIHKMMEMYGVKDSAKISEKK
jgi:coenzyme F420-reducing hydrogenase gamma subunit